MGRVCSKSGQTWRTGGDKWMNIYGNRNLIRQILMANLGLVNAGHSFLEPITLQLRDDVYSREELAQKFERGRQGGNIDFNHTIASATASANVATSTAEPHSNAGQGG